MAKINRYLIIRIHMLLAAFLLPIAIMYFISGALYTLDVKGHIDKQTIMLKLEHPFSPNIDVLFLATKQALLEKQLPLPGGEPSLKKKKGSYELSWGDLKHAVKLRPTSDPMVVQLIIRERNVLAQVMRIHRADAGSAFKFFAIFLVAGLIIMFVTGIYMALTVAQLRKPAFITIAVGLFTFLGLLLI